MAQQSRSQTVLEEDPHFIPTKHNECSQPPVTQAPGDSMSSFGPQGKPVLICRQVGRQADRQTYT